MNEEQTSYVTGVKHGLTLSSSILDMEYKILEDKLKEYEINLKQLTKEELLAIISADIAEANQRATEHIEAITAKSDAGIYTNRRNLPKNIKEMIEKLETEKNG